MSFIVNEPTANELMSVSQGVLNTNNGILAASFARDHIALTDGDALERGKHRWSKYKNTNPPAIPEPTLLADQSEGVVYTKNADKGLYYKHYNTTGVLIDEKLSSSTVGGNILAACNVTVNGNVITLNYNINIASAVYIGPAGTFRFTFSLPVLSTNYYVLSNADSLAQISMARVDPGFSNRQLTSFDGYIMALPTNFYIVVIGQ